LVFLRRVLAIVHFLVVFGNLLIEQAATVFVAASSIEEERREGKERGVSAASLQEVLIG
jgi:hypothetical protein